MCEKKAGEEEEAVGCESAYFCHFVNTCRCHNNIYRGARDRGKIAVELPQCGKTKKGEIDRERERDGWGNQRDFLSDPLGLRGSVERETLFLHREISGCSSNYLANSSHVMTLCVRP